MGCLRHAGEATGPWRNHVQSKKRSARKRPAHFVVQIPVRRRDDADVDLHRLVASERLELLLLEHAQRLDLGLERQFADLVQEQRASVGKLDAPDAPFERSGERTFTRPRSSLSDEIGWNRPTHSL